MSNSPYAGKMIAGKPVQNWNSSGTFPMAKIPLECVDLFPAGTNAPVHIFFHGGYWHSQDKDHFEFPAPAFVKNRLTYVCANYPLCPGVSFSEQMHSCRKLLLF